MPSPKWKKVEDLKGELYPTSSKKPWLVFVADNETDLLDVCQVESERSWIARRIHNISDPQTYTDLRDEYVQEPAVLAERRSRARNALVHGNPIAIQMVESVNSIASYLSRDALRVGVDSFVTGDDVRLILDREEQQNVPLLNGTSAADHWRA